MQYIAIAVSIIAALTIILFRYRVPVLICVSLISFLFGMARVAYVYENRVVDWDSLYETEVQVTGVVKGDIESRGPYSRYVFNVHTLTDETGAVYQPEGAILIYEPYPTACIPGEKLSVSVRLQEPEDFLTEANRIFRYKQHLRQLGIYATSSLHENICIGESDRTPIFPSLRKYFTSAIQNILPVQEGSLLGGLILGLRGNLSDELLELFRITGLMHIIVLSGYNITLVAEAIRRLLSRMHRTVSIVGSLVAIVAFVLLAGAQTAAIRAGSMAVIALVARANYREYDGVRILFLVGALMALYNPDQVLFSMSFHMSFLATLGLLLYTPIVERYLTRIPERFQLRGIISATLSTQFFLLPYLAYAIGEVSIVGILANILILPIVPIAMLSGFILIVVTLAIPIVAGVIAPLAYLPLAAIIGITRVLAIEHAMLALPEISTMIMIVTVAILTYVGLRKSRGQ